MAASLDGYSRIGAEVILQAIHDASHKNSSAIDFLTTDNPTLDLWCRCVGLDPAVVMQRMRQRFL